MGGSQGNSNHKNPFEPPSCAHPAEAPDVRAALKSTGSHSRHTASKNTIYHNNTTPATLVPSPSKPHPLESHLVAPSSDVARPRARQPRRGAVRGHLEGGLARHLVPLCLITARRAGN